MKTLLCAIAKNENNYIQEWVDHYKKLGFDKIVIYDNNDVDGEEIINLDNVEIVNVRGKKGTICYYDKFYSQQLDCYNECYDKYKNDYDWFFFCDIDEFLQIEKYTNVKDYLSQSIFKDYNNIKICWKYYGDNNILNVENNDYSVKRFKQPDTSRFAQNIFVKSFIQGGLNIHLNSAHGFDKGKLYSADNEKIVKPCNAIGQPDIIEQVLKEKRIIHSGAWVNHYRFKTIEEFVKCKIKRGWPDNFAEFASLDLNTFFANNQLTGNKYKLAMDLLKTQTT